MTKRIIPFSPPDVGEEEINEIAAAVRSGWITTGPRTKLLEQKLAEYIGTRKVVCLSSATAAEELNLRILGVGDGDEVIVPAYTYTATASAVIHCGARVVFADIKKDGDARSRLPEIDYEKLETLITSRTKAIVAVDLGGLVCDYDRLFEIVEKKRSCFRPKEPDGTLLGDISSKIQKGLGCIAVLSDCAHSLGASRVVSRTAEGPLGGPERRSSGHIAAFSSFSFHAVKNFTTAEGGASTWCLPDSVYRNGVTDEELYQIYQLLSLHGQNKDALLRKKKGIWEYDIIGPWYKCNMTDLTAAIGLKQLERYPGFLERRFELIGKYDAVCDSLGIPHFVHHTDVMDSSRHLYIIRIPGACAEERNELIEKMEEMGVMLNVHYKPLPMMTAYKALGWDIKDFPNSFDYYRNAVTLPLYTRLSDDDADYVCSALKKLLG